jgi:hypothetical protein
MISGVLIFDVLCTNSSIRFFISSRLKGMTGNQQTICPHEKTVIFFSDGRVGCRQNPSLYKTGMQEGDNNTGEIGAEQRGLELCKEWVDKQRGYR